MLSAVATRFRKIFGSLSGCRPVRKRPKDLIVIPERINLGIARKALLLARRLETGVMAAGGSLIGCARNGGQVTIITLEEGEMEWEPVRRAFAAAGVKEAQCWQVVAGREEEVLSFLRKLSPELLLVPSPVEDERALFLFSRLVARSPALDQVKRILGYELRTPLLPDGLVDVTPYMSFKDGMPGPRPEIDLSFSLNQYRSVSAMRGHGFAEAFLTMTPGHLGLAAEGASISDMDRDRDPIPFFRGLSLLPGDGLRQWVNEEEPCPVLILSPHFDDETIGCGGTIARHVDRGDPTAIVFATDGREGDPRESDRDLVSGIRKREAREAAAILGVTVLEFLDRPETRLRPGEGLEEQIRVILDRTDSRVVYLPSFLENHIDHLELNRIFYRAIRGRMPEIEVRLFGLWTPFPPNHIVDISSVVDRKVRAVNRYRSQLTQVDYLSATISLNRYWSIRFGNPRGYIEAFYSIGSDRYCSLIEELEIDRERFDGKRSID